jgi:hypothetical protein
MKKTNKSVKKDSEKKSTSKDKESKLKTTHDKFDDFIVGNKKSNKKPVKKSNVSDSENSDDEKIRYSSDDEKTKCVSDTENTKKNTKDENKNTNTNTTQDAPVARKRGRPKKIISPRQQVKVAKQNILSVHELENLQETSSIILRLPLYNNESSETSQKNQFTMKDESDLESEHREDEISDKYSDDNKVNNFSVYLTDESDDKPNLKKEIKKKNVLIKQLQDEIHTRSEQYVESTSSLKLNMKLFNTKIVGTDNSAQIAEKTKIACWWCTYNFDTPPCFIPEKYRNDKYYVFGCFCSYNCALAYILKDDEYKIDTRKSLVKKLYSELYNTTTCLSASPSREVLQKFGGPLTIEEYRDQKNLESKNYKLVLEPIQCYFEESYKDPMMSTYVSNSYHHQHYHKKNKA